MSLEALSLSTKLMVFEEWMFLTLFGGYSIRGDFDVDAVCYP